MDRKKALEKAFQRGHLLTLKTEFYRKWFERYILDETKEDWREGDITTDAVIRKDIRVKAVVRSRQPGILAGIEESSELYRRNGIDILGGGRDGSCLDDNTIILELHGYQKDLLRIERSALDILQRMSGIATLTSNVISGIRGKVSVAPTRKTHWRYMDKKAVFLGGGLTHRLALWESILIKDNHLAALRREGVKDPIETALQRCKDQQKAKFLEIEVTSRDHAQRAAEILALMRIPLPKLIMFDNMPALVIKQIIAHFKRSGLYDSALFEASGGITPKSIGEYSSTGVDVISMGYLTHFSPALDIKQEML